MANWNLLCGLVFSSALVIGTSGCAGGSTGDDTSDQEETDVTEETDVEDNDVEVDGMIPTGLLISGFFGWDGETAIPYTVDGNEQLPVVILTLTDDDDNSCDIALSLAAEATATTETWDQTEDGFDDVAYDIVHTGIILTPDIYSMETDCVLGGDWTVEGLLGDAGWGIGVGTLRGDVEEEWAAAVDENPDLQDSFDSLVGGGLYIEGLTIGAGSGYIGFNYAFGFELDETNAIVMDGDAPVNLTPEVILADESGALPHGAYAVQSFGGLVFQ